MAAGSSIRLVECSSEAIVGLAVEEVLEEYGRRVGEVDHPELSQGDSKGGGRAKKARRAMSSRTPACAGAHVRRLERAATGHRW